MDTDQSLSAAAGSSVAISPVVYVALGDSTGVGVGAVKGGYVARLFHRIQRIQGGSRLVNVCESGATSEDALHAQVDRAVDAGPTLVTVCIGINDVTHNIPAPRFAQNLEQIIKRLRDSGAVRVLLTNVPDVSLAPIVPRLLRPEARRRVGAYNACISELAARHAVSLFDLYHHSRELIPQHPNFFSHDRFHPSDEGYEHWATVMWPSIRASLGISVSAPCL